MNIAYDQLGQTLATSAERQRRSLAAFVLGSLPKRQPKKWTGWLRDVHLWRGRKVVLPNGRVGGVYGSVRGQVIVRVEDPLSILGFVDRVYDADDLAVYKLPAAVELGRGKRGVKEQPSTLKAASSRVNGYAPARPGSPPRGRPRKRPSQ